MSTPLLATKLFIPDPRSALTARPRLIDLLNEKLRGGLTVVSVPPGSARARF